MSSMETVEDNRLAPPTVGQEGEASSGMDVSWSSRGHGSITLRPKNFVAFLRARILTISRPPT
jgi:hypothetical protein